MDDLVHHHEREAIIKALQQTNYNKAKAAHILGIPAVLCIIR